MSFIMRLIMRLINNEKVTVAARAATTRAATTMLRFSAVRPPHTVVFTGEV